MQYDKLSLLTLYAGVGYDLITGSPEGDFDVGGIDPGIKITRKIFKLSYTQNKKAYYLGNAMNVPDQVLFHASHACSSSEAIKIFMGEKSYQSDLSVSVQAEGNSASQSLQQYHQKGNFFFNCR